MPSALETRSRYWVGLEDEYHDQLSSTRMLTNAKGHRPSGQRTYAFDGTGLRAERSLPRSA